jgi:ATP-dependent helicase/nuclease subunit B
MCIKQLFESCQVAYWPSPVANPRVFAFRSASARLSAAREALGGAPRALIVGASRAAADEFAHAITAERGATFGITRVGFGELVARLAVPALAKQGFTPSAPLGDEAVAARVAFEALADGALSYFTPVADMPGFPRALGRTLAELRMAEVPVADLAGHKGSTDLAVLLERAVEERRQAGAVDYADMLDAATTQLANSRPSDCPIALIDCAIGSAAEARFVNALIAAAPEAFVTIPPGDARTLSHFQATAETHGKARTSLEQLQRHLFGETPAGPVSDDTVTLFSAPGEGREAVEIARRILQEANRGVRFDDIAVILRAPQTYLGVLEHALDRAGIPAWFNRGTRRPDPAGRAMLALLACAAEDLAARRFAEYVSLGQVPLNENADADTWAAPTDELVEAVLPEADRPEDPQPEDDIKEAAKRGATDRDLAGTLRAPWRWEDLIIKAIVIGGMERWRRRLGGLANEYEDKLREAISDDPDSSLVRALERDREQLHALKSFALPILEEMSGWPEQQSWGAWIQTLRRLAPRVIGKPARVLRVLHELNPLSAIGPIGLREVRDVLAPRLSTLTHEPPRRRHGKVFVGTPHAARGRSFRVVFVPGLAERMFPQKIREDALLPDNRRERVAASLATVGARAADERLHLTLAVGAASERLHLSYPRIELSESRPRVPSFYVLDILRAIEGQIPAASSVTDRASKEGQSTLAWPAPRDPATAVDDFEHDLSTMGALLAERDPAAVRGRARYLYELSPELQRSLTSRWFRWHRKSWETADGLVRPADAIKPALAAQRLGARPYSLTALQRFSSCPYQFLLAAIYRLAPLEPPAPLQQLDPLTRGDLFHRFQAAALRRLQKDGLLPLSDEALPRAQQMLLWAIKEVEDEAYDRLNPAIDRVWKDEIGAMTQDLKMWLERLAAEGAEWTPERFEYSFGLASLRGHDEHSTTTPAFVDQRFLLRGSIDMVERHRQTKFLRVTDHKTGRNRTKSGQTMVEGGRVLQPVLYGLALESLLPSETVYSGRLSFCTTTGGFTQHEIPLLGQARRTGLEVLEIIDRAVDHGLLAARPAQDACGMCDFQPVCGREEEKRTKRKDPALFSDLEALRALE